MDFNLYIFPLAAIIPLAVGAVWYNPKVLGNAWLSTTNLKEEDIQGGNMLKIFGLAYLLSLMASIALLGMVVHQVNLLSILASEPGIGEAGSEVQTLVDDFLAKYGNNHRSFGHGLFHGIINVLFFGLPIIGTIALFERKSFKYVAIHVGYWVIAIGLMGGVICQFA